MNSCWNCSVILVTEAVQYVTFVDEIRQKSGELGVSAVKAARMIYGKSVRSTRRFKFIYYLAKAKPEEYADVSMPQC